MRTTASPPSWLRPWQGQSFSPEAKIGFLLLLGIDAVSIFGYSLFSLHPEYLAKWPWTLQIYAHSYSVSAQLQILASFAVLGGILHRHIAWRWLASFFVVAVICSASELSGTSYGVPFGKYEYTDLLGAKIAGKVPWLIPISWFFMALPSFAIAKHLRRQRMGKFSRLRSIFAGAFLLSAWDLTLDPAMSRLAPFWLWSEPGIYFGSPLLNLFGWFVTGCAVMAALTVMKTETWLQRVPVRYFYVFYALNLLLPIGLVVAAGLWLPVAISLVAFAIVAWIA